MPCRRHVGCQAPSAPLREIERQTKRVRPCTLPRPLRPLDYQRGVRDGIEGQFVELTRIFDPVQINVPDGGV